MPVGMSLPTFRRGLWLCHQGAEHSRKSSQSGKTGIYYWGSSPIGIIMLAVVGAVVEQAGVEYVVMALNLGQVSSTW